MMAVPGRMPIMFDANSEDRAACMNVMHRSGERG